MALDSLLIQARLFPFSLLSHFGFWDLDYFNWEKVYPLAFDRVKWGHLLFIHRVYFFLSLMQTLSDYIPFLLINKCISGLGFLFICFQSLLLIGLSWAWSYHAILLLLLTILKEGGISFLAYCIAQGERKDNLGHIYITLISLLFGRVQYSSWVRNVVER